MPKPAPTKAMAGAVVRHTSRCPISDPRPSSPALGHGPVCGFTLIELLVSMTITLILMLGIVSLFGDFTSGIDRSMTSLSLSERLRQTRDMLQQDLNQLTVDPSRLPKSVRTAGGAFGISEGSERDRDNTVIDTSTDPATPPERSWLGDRDDKLYMTIFSKDLPVSNIGGTATAAEVIWEWSPDSNSDTGTGKLYRYVAPIVGGVTSRLYPDEAELTIGPARPSYRRIFDSNGAELGFKLNSLKDLEFQKNRTGHIRSILGGPLSSAPIESVHLVLDNVVSFDVQVFDPYAPLFRAVVLKDEVYFPGNGLFTLGLPGTKHIIIKPGDPYYKTAVTEFNGLSLDDKKTMVAGYGAYVDLPATKTITSGGTATPYTDYYAMETGQEAAENDADVAKYVPLEIDGVPVQRPHFNKKPGNIPLGSGGTANEDGEYDTWTSRADPEVSNIPNASNGIDDDNDGLIDEPDEGPQPPYNHGLQSVQITIRVFDRPAGVIRQVTIRQAFGN